MPETYNIALGGFSRPYGLFSDMITLRFIIVLRFGRIVIFPQVFNIILALEYYPRVRILS